MGRRDKARILAIIAGRAEPYRNNSPAHKPIKVEEQYPEVYPMGTQAKVDEAVRLMKGD